MPSLAAPPVSLRRRTVLRLAAGAMLLGAAAPLPALTPQAPGIPDDAARLLTPAQSRAFRAWMVRIAEEQFRKGPTPRWTHRDCAGLIRFAVAEALADHDLRWQKAMGMARPLPPDLIPAELRGRLRHRWRRPDGSSGAYVSALGLIQENTRFVSKDVRLAQPADLLFFDQGDAQHLMLWTGRRVVYHTGAAPRPDDDGLRAVTMRELREWNDSRWRPEITNPNFSGVFTLAFLS